MYYEWVWICFDIDILASYKSENCICIQRWPRGKYYITRQRLLWLRAWIQINVCIMYKCCDTLAYRCGNVCVRQIIQFRQDMMAVYETRLVLNGMTWVVVIEYKYMSERWPRGWPAVFLWWFIELNQVIMR